MKFAVVYSSLTGNTKKIALAIQQALPAATPLIPIQEANAELNAYDCVFLGYWVDKGTADNAAKKVLNILNPKHIALFATLGADPNSEHGAASITNGINLLPDKTKVVDTFICQGAVDPKLIAQMEKMFPPGHPHALTPERRARQAEAAKHPDANDIQGAKEFAKKVLAKLEQ